MTIADVLYLSGKGLYKGSILEDFMDNYTIILNKLKQFRKKYYRNQLIKGVIFSASIFLFLFLVLNMLEYFGYYSESTRRVFFYLLLVVNAFVLGYYIIFPLGKIYNLGRTIDDFSAARLIGKFFPEIRDKLLNAIQLKKSAEISDKNAELIIASINQRTNELSPIPFQQAINYRVNKKYLKFAVPLLIVFLGIFLVSPAMITEPSKRIVQYNRHFERPAPFSITIVNQTLSAIQNEDFELLLKTEGEVIPEELFIHYQGKDFRMKKEDQSTFKYHFRKLQKSFDFHIYYGDFMSDKYEMNVYPRPSIISFDTHLDYPSYTGRKDESTENTGDLIVPEGTLVSWKFYTRDVRAVNFSLNGLDTTLRTEASNTFTYARGIYQTSEYSVWANNEYVEKSDSLRYRITAIKDVYPGIVVEQQKDSSLSKRFFFNGFIRDDYGFSELTFNYSYRQEQDSVQKVSLFNLIDRGNNQEQFYYSTDFRQMNLVPGDEIEYYFEVWDNDAVNGHKRSRSKIFSYRLPTMDEVYDQLNAENDNIEKGLEAKLKDLSEVNKQIDEFSKQLLQKEQIDWQDKQKASQLIKKEEEIREELEDLIKRNKENLNRFEQTETDSQIMEKQRRLQELMEEVLDEETRKMIEEINEMLEEYSKEKMQDMMERMKMSNEDLEQQLDRNIELMKQIEYERKMNELSEKLQKMAEEQEKLSEETAENNSDKEEELSNKQEDLKEDFDKIKQELDELEEKNKELEDPFEELDTEQQEQSIDQEMNESMENLQKSKMKNASQNQKNASQKMQEMSEMMMQFMQAQTSQQTGEDITLLREILENLVQASFDQEHIMDRLSRIEQDDPEYPQMLTRQNDLQDNLKIIEDSLVSLSKRQPTIEGFVLKEINSIHENIDIALDAIKEKQIQLGTTRQQYIMTAINNLALFLAESLNQMKNQMNMQSQSQMQGKGTCPSPGGKGKTSMRGLKNLQQQLNQQMQQLQNSMKGKGKQGQDGQNGMSMNEQLARMAAEQAAIREKLQDYIDELKEQGLGDQGLSEALEEMEKTEEELVNKKVSQSMLERQKNILTRLLKSERAELEREKKKERESKEAKSIKRSNPAEFLEYNRLKTNEAELLKTMNPKLKIFYKKKVNAYFYKSGLIEKDNESN